MYITPIDTSKLGTEIGSTTGTTAKNSMDPKASQDRFLKLLVAQLNNQDPMNPMDNAQMTSQMAQISTVSGIEKLNTTVEKLNGQFVQMQAVQGAGLVGKDVLVAGNKITLDTDCATTIGFDLDTVAKNVVVSVKDSSGKIVDTLNLGTTKAGQQTFNWQSADKTATGLTFEVSATDASGKAVGATKLVLDKGLLLSATLRSTRANQNGLLGFGAAAPGRNSRSLQPEFSVAWLLRRDLAIGAEVRFQPDNLQATGRAAGLGSALREDAWKDIFIAWAPSKNLSFTLAWADLGRVVPGITNGRRQSGAYFSAQVAF